MAKTKPSGRRVTVQPGQIVISSKVFEDLQGTIQHLQSRVSAGMIRTKENASKESNENAFVQVLATPEPKRQTHAEATLERACKAVGMIEFVASRLSTARGRLGLGVPQGTACDKLEPRADGAFDKIDQQIQTAVSLLEIIAEHLDAIETQV